jgi:hypothetical protein
MSSYSHSSEQSSFSCLSRAFAYRRGARFTGLIEPAFFQSLADKHHVHFGSAKDDTYNPAVTTWAWLSQVLSPAKSCVAAVSRVMTLCCGLGRSICSLATGAFCKARAKLPEAFARDAAVGLGQALEDHAADGWKWHGRSVKYVDGSVLQLPDTPENLEHYPQQRSQKKGTSPTCMRVVVLLAFATGALIDAAYGPYRGKNTGEMSLLRQILGRIAAGEIVVGDRLFGSYLLLALLRGQGSDGCFRLNLSREKDFRQGERLGEDDYLQTWSKTRRPKNIDKDFWDSLPEQIQVRVLRIRVEAGRGFRSEDVYLVTTLCDAQKYRKEDIAALYRGRWHVELDIRALKQGLGLKMLSCKTPAMVRTELWMHLLGYNLVRCVMAQAAWDKGVKPRQLSFSGAVQVLDAFRWLLTCGNQDRELLGQVISTAVATHRVGKRPDRHEPRETKHRQRKFKELKKSRHERRQELLAADTGKKEKGRGKDRPSGR